MKQPLLIQIKNPCNEKWDEMTLVEQGKYCSNCQKTVIDFSTKTDAELFVYFNNHTSFCGRFRQTQINRIIEEPKPVLKRLFHFYSKIVALFFTAFSFKSFQISAQTNQPTIENFVQNADEIHPGKITIEGIITDDEDRLVDSVAIFFDNAKVATSNQLGYYKVEVENIVLKNHVLSFDKNEYRSFAFSFHPLMGNIKQNVTMCNYKEKNCSYSMGMPARVITPFQNYTLHIKNINTKLEIDSIFKDEIIILGYSLRGNPNNSVILNFYYSNTKDKKLYENKGQKIINYLVENQRIDRERLHLKIIKNAKKVNTIEIVDYNDSY